MQPTNILVENVLVLCVTGQCAMHCIIQLEKFLCVLVKSLMRSLGSFFQCIDCINHGGKRRELHLQTLLQFGPQHCITFGLQVCEH